MKPDIGIVDKKCNKKVRNLYHMTKIYHPLQTSQVPKVHLGTCTEQQTKYVPKQELGNERAGKLEAKNLRHFTSLF
jgi:hypothetical protein